jgi:hypothetical protein
MIRTVVLATLLYFTCPAQTDDVYTGRDTTKAPKEKPRPKNDEWKKKFNFGGNFQAWFGNPTFVFLSPTVGYMLTDNLNVGVGGIYNYTQVNLGTYGKFKQSIFGSHSYLRYIIAQNYFLQTQFDKLYQPDYYSTVPDRKLWVDYWLVGGGLRQPIGDKAAIITSLMYNLTPNVLSIYPSRLIVQFGFVAGF